MSMKFSHVMQRLEGFVNVWTGTEIKDYNLRQALISFVQVESPVSVWGTQVRKNTFYPGHTPISL